MSLADWTRRASGLLLPQLGFANTNKLGPGCCCSSGCTTILADTFDRANSTNLGSNWSEVAGDWEISSNALKITATSNAICQSTIDGDTSDVYIETTLRSSESGSRAGVLVAYQDDDNYVAVFVAFGGSTFFIVERVSGVNSTLANILTTYIPLDTDVSLKVCFTSSRRISVVFRGDSVASRLMNTPVNSGKWALATGALTSGSVQFKTVTATNVLDSCDCSFSTCASCESGQLPYEWQLDISGYQAGNCATNYCETRLNGTFVLTSNVMNEAYCSWKYTESFPTDVRCHGFSTGTHRTFLVGTLPVAPGTYALVLYVDIDIYCQDEFRYTSGSNGLPCDQSMSLTYYSSNCPSPVECDRTNVAITLTPLPL